MPLWFHHAWYTWLAGSRTFYHSFRDGNFKDAIRPPNSYPTILTFPSGLVYTLVRILVPVFLPDGQNGIVRCRVTCFVCLRIQMLGLHNSNQLLILHGYY